MYDNEEQITLVTAFFPIGRAQWDTSSRSDDRYFAYFRRWAGIKNDLIVFCPTSYAQRIKKIRIRQGGGKTRLVTIDRFDDLIPGCWAAFKQIISSYEGYSIFPNLPETKQADYDYVMALKSWCIKEAGSLASDSQLAWIDFGFDHGGTYYKDAKAKLLSQEWRYKSTKNVTLFAIHPLDETPIFDVVRRTDTYIQGDSFIVRTNYAQTFYVQIQQEYSHLIACGLPDDDQTTLLMLAKDHPEVCAVLPSRWFSMIHDYREENRNDNGVSWSDTLSNPFTIRQKLSWAKYCARFAIQEARRLYAKPRLE